MTDQFIRGTLEGLVKQLGIPEDAKFTPELQDQLALALLNGRGYGDWKAGRIGTDEFATNLSKEWPSLPNPATGRSYYAGDGLNAALTSAEDFTGNLTAARGREI